MSEEGIVQILALLNDFKSEMKQEIGKLREEMHQEIGSLREEMHQEIGALREEMHQEIGKLREEMHQEIDKLREEMHQEIRRIEKKIDANYIELMDEYKSTQQIAAKLYDKQQQQIEELQRAVGIQ